MKNKIKLVECEAFVDSVGLRVPFFKRKVGMVKVSSDWLRYINSVDKTK